MIIVKLKGGLGNQLFQFAAGRQLAIKHNCELKLDILYYSETQRQPELQQYPRFFMLNNFCIKATIASDQEIELIKHPYHSQSFISFFYKGLRRLLPSSFPGKFVEKTLDYDPCFSRVPDNVYLDGYWGSERYFRDSADIIRAELSFKDLNLYKYATHYVENIRQFGEPVIALHVRRGDVAYAHEQLGRPDLVPVSLLSCSYYDDAMSAFDVNSAFIVFSESPPDIKWCRENLRGHNLHFSDGHSDLQDFAIMLACDHNIISNSTFSWWAAWLNRSSDKVVIAPRQWYEPGSKYDHNMSDLIPADWRLV